MDKFKKIGIGIGIIIVIISIVIQFGLESEVFADLSKSMTIKLGETW